MAIVSKQEFADLCGDNVNKLSVYISRSKVAWYDEKAKTLDTKNPLNAAFIKMRKEFNAIKSGVKNGRANTVKNSHRHSNENDWEYDNVNDQPEPLSMEMIKAIEGGKLDGYTGELSAQRLMYKKLKGDAEWAETRAEREKLLLSKAQGSLLPSELVFDVYKSHARCIFDNFITGIENMAVTFVSKVGGDIAIQVAFVQEARLILSRCVKDAGNQANQEIEAIITNYAESRGIGEKKR